MMANRLVVAVDLGTTYTGKSYNPLSTQILRLTA
jgi:hypothetical protein